MVAPDKPEIDPYAELEERASTDDMIDGEPRRRVRLPKQRRKP
jgi:hypothetical protein